MGRQHKNVQVQPKPKKKENRLQRKEWDCATPNGYKMAVCGRVGGGERERERESMSFITYLDNQWLSSSIRKDHIDGSFRLCWNTTKNENDLVLVAN